MAGETQIELLQRGDIPVARVSNEWFTFEEDLPIGFLSWSKEEIEAHFRRFVTPVLKTKMVNAMAMKDKGAITEKDMTKLAKAQIKRTKRKTKGCK